MHSTKRIVLYSSYVCKVATWEVKDSQFDLRLPQSAYQSVLEQDAEPLIVPIYHVVTGMTPMAIQLWIPIIST